MSAPGTNTGTRRCAVCHTLIRDGVVCPEHREARRERPLSTLARTVEELPLESLGIPRLYQRELRESRVRQIIREFDTDLLGLLVVTRDLEGGLWILDGQHRWLALVQLGYTTALCEVLHEASMSRQAQIFNGRNSRRTAPRPRDAFRADHVARQPQVVAIMAVLDRHGYRAPYGGTNRGAANRFVCVSALREVHGWGLLEPTVALIRVAWPADELATQAPILLGLAAMLRLYPELAEDELTRRLARHSPDEVLRLARAQQASSRDRRLWAHVAEVVVALHNHGRPAARRLPAVEVPYDAARRWKVERPV